MRDFHNLPDSFLTWCDDCGLSKEDAGVIRNCAECEAAICGECYVQHRCEDEDEDFDEYLA